MLPDARIAVRAAAIVPDDFDARFSATRRRYRYRIVTAPEPDPFRDRYSWLVRDALRLGPMRVAAKHLVGEHDFGSFCRKGQGSLTRRVRSLTVRRASSGARTGTANDEIWIEVCADSFCHQMVRALVGWLVACGRGERDPAETPQVLGARDRHAAALIAPPRGLTLIEVRYPRDPFR